MYYRVATQMDEVSSWQWKSTVIRSLDALFQSLLLVSQAKMASSFAPRV